jgi:uncharacterized phage protein (TIGR01671 family)
MGQAENSTLGGGDMREIKFRAWYTGYKGKETYYPEMIYDEKPGDCLKWKNEGQILKLMQYTGLKDKNGKEIYEGDIVEAWSEGKHGKFEIRWRQDGGGTPSWLMYPAWQEGEIWRIASSREKDGNCYDRGLEIIGNIYENPELLGGE